MEKVEKVLWKRVRRYLPFLRFVPFLRMVAVCNNISFGRVTEKSDIDLFVVAKSGRLFTVRLFSIFILHVLGVRAHGRKFPGRFCLSFFVDDSSLDLSKIAISDDIYLALWTKSILPILDDGVGDVFVAKNSWARSYFEPESRFELDKSNAIAMKSTSRWILEYFFSGRFGSFFENSLKKWQLKRARGKMKNFGSSASIIIDEHMLKFHHNDKRSHYRDAWLRIYGREVKLSKEKFLAL